MKINKLNVLLMGVSIASILPNYAAPKKNQPTHQTNKRSFLTSGEMHRRRVNPPRPTQLEPVYLSQVIQHIKKKEDLVRFIQVNKKCRESLSRCNTNFIPVYDKETYELTYNHSTQATFTKHKTSFYGHIELDQDFNFIVHTPEYTGMIVGGTLSIDKFNYLHISNAIISDINGKIHHCGDLFIAIRYCNIILWDENHANQFDFVVPETHEIVFDPMDKTVHLNFLFTKLREHSAVGHYAQGSIFWNIITYKDLKFGNEFFREVIVELFLTCQGFEYNPEETMEMRLMDFTRPKELKQKPLENICFIKEVCFGDLPEDCDVMLSKENDKLFDYEKDLCNAIVFNPKFLKTTLSFFLKSKFMVEASKKKCYTPNEYWNIYQKSIQDVLIDTYDLDKHTAYVINKQLPERIIVIETEEGFIVSLPDALQGSKPICETSKGFKLFLPNITYTIPQEFIIQENLEKTMITVSFPRAMVIKESWEVQAPNTFIICLGSNNLLIRGQENRHLRGDDNIDITISSDDLNVMKTEDSSISSYETKYNTNNLMLKIQPHYQGKRVIVFQFE